MKVLDHGEVNLVEVWGSDENIIRAARQSTDGAFRGWEDTWVYQCGTCGYRLSLRKEYPGKLPRCPNYRVYECPTLTLHEHQKGDQRLLKYLYTHKHMTPFEMAGAIFEVKAPIFVFREWHRHRTQSYNEMSARYIPIPDENYLPSVERLLTKATANKQAQGVGSELTEDGAKDALYTIEMVYDMLQKNYEHLLGQGVSKELARLILPVGRYSKMWASANLRNWMQFLELRNAPDAQWEIQEYAKAVQELLKEAFPRTIELFEEGR